MTIHFHEAVPFDLDEAGSEYYQDAWIYDHDFHWYKLDAPFYRNMVGSIGGPVLEIGCGTGRLMVPWLKDGLKVTGVDLSEDMLERARQKIARLGKATAANATLIQKDMRKLRFRSQFNVAVCAFNTMMHLYTHEDISLFLRGVHRALVTDGTFMFDVLNPDFRWLMRDPAKRWSRIRFKHPHYGTTYHYTTNHYYDAHDQIVYVYVYHEPVDEKDGPSYVLRFGHRIFFPQEMKYLLETHGFEVENLFGGFDGSDLELYSTTSVFICRRR
ncbi:class I SAM-dependent methyltransferase [Myxococcota bacterium]|nr:class I SAM-dependent methyltransferase [Myxococcota bacterium]MBU1411602.1 class I SAM-dependent methyltransferase [Myxococcota bacterium]MBU1509074.1 class I SAM-dependent methyltransferase [Myxococcota bacterium]